MLIYTLQMDNVLSNPVGVFFIAAVIGVIIYLIVSAIFIKAVNVDPNVTSTQKYRNALLMQLPFYLTTIYILYEVLKQPK